LISQDNNSQYKGLSTEYFTKIIFQGLSLAGHVALYESREESEIAIIAVISDVILLWLSRTETVYDYFSVLSLSD
jgi:hypothetical protein